MARSQAKAKASGSPALQASCSSAHTQLEGRGSTQTDSSTTVRPFVSTKFDLPMLEDDGYNYDFWSKVLTLAVQSRGLWLVVNGSESAPDGTTDPPGYDEWCFKDRDAQLIILLALRKVGWMCICRAQTSKESWDLLRTRYSGGREVRAVSLLSQVLLLATFSDTEPLQPQLDTVIFANQKLESVNLAIPDVVLAYLLALRLPESYSILRTALTRSSFTKISSNWVADQVIAEEHYRVAQSGGNATTFFAKAKKDKSGRNTNDQKCSYCKRKGHTKSNCRKLKKEQEEQKAAETDGTGSISTSSNNPSTATAFITRTDAHPSGGIVRLYRAIAVPRRARGAKRTHIAPLSPPMDPVLVNESSIQAPAEIAVTDKCDDLPETAPITPRSSSRATIDTRSRATPMRPSGLDDS